MIARPWAWADGAVGTTSYHLDIVSELGRHIGPANAMGGKAARFGGRSVGGGGDDGWGGGEDGGGGGDDVGCGGKTTKGTTSKAAEVVDAVPPLYYPSDAATRRRAPGGSFGKAGAALPLPSTAGGRVKGFEAGVSTRSIISST